MTATLTKTITITKDDALRGLREAVAERGPDFIYQRHDQNGGAACRYWYKDKPDCLIALALFKLGVPGELIATLYGSINAQPVPALLLGGGYVLTDAARKVFSAAQSAQDGRQTWGEALGTGERVARDF